MQRGDRVRVTEGPYAGRVGRVVEVYLRAINPVTFGEPYAAHIEFEVRGQDTSYDVRMLTVFTSQLEPVT